MATSASFEKVEKVLESIAASHGVSVEEVRREILVAMEVGMAEPNPAVKEMWSSIPCAGEKPTPEELIMWAVAKILKS